MSDFSKGDRVKLTKATPGGLLRDGDTGVVKENAAYGIVPVLWDRLRRVVYVGTGVLTPA
jgi:hypothetical protein